MWVLKGHQMIKLWLSSRPIHLVEVHLNTWSSFMHTQQWFTIQKSKGLCTNWWFTERWCVGLHIYIVHQKTRSRLTHKSTIQLVSMWQYDWCAMCGAVKRYKVQPPQQRLEYRYRDKEKHNPTSMWKMMRLVWLVVHIKFFDSGPALICNREGELLFQESWWDMPATWQTLVPIEILIHTGNGIIWYGKQCTETYDNGPGLHWTVQRQ